MARRPLALKLLVVRGQGLSIEDQSVCEGM